MLSNSSKYAIKAVLYLAVNSSVEKKIMVKDLKMNIYPYPKGKNKRYDTSYEPLIQCRLF